MIGSALGDAIGELAFHYPQRDRLLSEIERSPELRYTDDTAMALALAESLVAVGDVEVTHLGDTFRRHFHREPWRGYASGPPTVFAMVEQQGLDYQEAARRLYGGQGSLGNGAAMRIAPLGLFFGDSPLLYDKAQTAASVTHSHPVGVDGAATQAKAVALAAALDPTREFPLQAFIHWLIAFARTVEMRAKLAELTALLDRDAPPDEAADQLGRGVEVHESLPFALYCFLRHPYSFEKCLLCAVLSEGDRDTVGAMSGAVSGAYLGEEAIPHAWADRLENRALIRDLACHLQQGCSAA